MSPSEPQSYLSGALRTQYPEAAAAQVASFDLAGHTFNGNRSPALMGVVNLSPESKHRDSVCGTTDEAVTRGRLLWEQGAAIVDVGAESSLADAAQVAAAAQIKALVPVVEKLAPHGVVSVETYHAEVAEACLEAGASVINLTGRIEAEAIFKLVAKYEAGVVICYSAGNHVREIRGLDTSGDAIPWLGAYFGPEIQRATQLGVNRLWIDPGLSFQYLDLSPEARRDYQLQVFANTFRLRKLGWPVCHALPYAFIAADGRRLPGAEPYYALLARMGGADLLRVHDVEPVAIALRQLFG